MADDVIDAMTEKFSLRDRAATAGENDEFRLTSGTFHYCNLWMVGDENLREDIGIHAPAELGHFGHHVFADLNRA